MKKYKNNSAVGVPIQIAGYKKAAEMEISFLVPLFGASFRL